eukprot:1153553-Pelagomonas_calceolata.AAC.5
MLLQKHSLGVRAGCRARQAQPLAAQPRVAVPTAICRSSRSSRLRVTGSAVAFPPSNEVCWVGTGNLGGTQAVSWNTGVACMGWEQAPAAVAVHYELLQEGCEQHFSGVCLPC